jgi:hypothetical protein
VDKSVLLLLNERSDNRLVGLLEDIPEDKLCYQPFPGANHALWTVGHLAVVNQRMTALMQDQQPAPPERYKELFDIKSIPSPDPTTYPPAAEVLQFAAKVREGWLNAIRAVDPARLEAAPPEPMRRFAPTWGVLIAAMSQHTAFHLGELAVIRKALGMAPKYA